ncbi:hypothetical protein [Massilia rhizosphaerae]|uniref:hypothetical protein n=1 Tax=Massilia rhizosphaerae TaxID=2784389 RepID=UPI0018DAFF00|nr:hypothetical protein [Massilia rhizosphaerae]
MSAIRKLFFAAALMNVVATAVAAEVTVDKDPPEHAQPHFFERVQAGDLAGAIARRGEPVDVKPGQYHLRVPCDSMKAGSFVDITVTIDDHSKTRLRLEECGVKVESR